MRPQHRDMVGDGLGVGRADADIDHGDAAMPGLGQVIGRHLRHARRRRAFLRRAFAGRRDDVAGLDEGSVAAAALGHQLARMDAELVDVELVVGEQHEVLEMVRAGRRVVRQPVQRIVDALRGERRQRQRLAGHRLERAVGDVVVGAVEVRHVEHVAERPLDAVGHRRRRHACLRGRRNAAGSASPIPRP